MKGLYKKRSILIIPIVLAATISLFWIQAQASHILSAPILANAFVDGWLKYLLLSLGLTMLVLIAAFALAPQPFRKYFSWGNIRALFEPVKALGLRANPGETWLHLGRNFALILSAITLIFIYLQAIRGNNIAPHHLAYIPWIIFFSAANSFIEEMITRFSVVVALDGWLRPQYVYLVSAAIFGTVHYFGTPGGVLGVFMAGFMGWFLAKSIGETRGIFWAWLIHFLQDVIIFTGFFFQNL